MGVQYYGPCAGCNRTSPLVVDDIYCSQQCKDKVRIPLMVGQYQLDRFNSRLNMALAFILTLVGVIVLALVLPRFKAPDPVGVHTAQQLLKQAQAIETTAHALTLAISNYVDNAKLEK